MLLQKELHEGADLKDQTLTERNGEDHFLPSIKLAKKILMTFPSGGKCVVKQTPMSVAQSYLLI